MTALYMRSTVIFHPYTALAYSCWAPTTCTLCLPASESTKVGSYDALRGSRTNHCHSMSTKAGLQYDAVGQSFEYETPTIQSIYSTLPRKRGSSRGGYPIAVFTAPAEGGTYYALYPPHMNEREVGEVEYLQWPTDAGSLSLK